MEKKLAIMNCNCIFMNLCMQDNYRHIVFEVGKYQAQIRVFAGYHAPILQKIKKAVLAGCLAGVGVEIQHYAEKEDSEAYSVLEISWAY